MECVNNIKVDTSRCLKPCSGLIVTSFTKFYRDKNIENLIPIVEDYDKYKIFSSTPPGLSGGE